MSIEINHTDEESETDESEARAEPLRRRRSKNPLTYPEQQRRHHQTRQRIQRHNLHLNNRQHSDRRAEFTPNTQARVLIQDARAHADRRAEFTPNTQARVLIQDAHAHADRRAELTPNAAYHLRATHAQQELRRRSNFTPNSIQEARNGHAQAERLRRALFSPATVRANREADRIAHSQAATQVREQRERDRADELEQGFQQPRAPAIEPHRKHLIARVNRTPLIVERNIATTHIVPANIGRMNIVCTDCGALNFTHENKSTATNPEFSICCGRGKVSLPPHSPIPEVLQDCYFVKPDNSNRNKVQVFKNHIRKINNALAFASVSANIVRFDRGPPVYKIQGQMYFRHSSLHGQGTSRYAQCYIMDAGQALIDREVVIAGAQPDRVSARDMALIRDILISFGGWLRDHNPFALIYRNMDTELTRLRALAETNNEQIPDLRMYIERDRAAATIHPGRLNEPLNVQNLELHAVFKSDEGAPENFDVCVFPLHRPGQHHLNNLSNKTLPLCYPALLPNGERGWDPTLHHQGRRRTAHRNRLTLLDFARFKLAVRQFIDENGLWHNQQLLHFAGKLMKQFTLHLYVNIESNNLHFFRTHQQQMRRELYSGLMDHVHRQAQQNAAQVGRVVILPSTFPGSPRAMIQHYQDAMCISREIGTPSIFLTFTCNPNWPCITENIFPGQSALERDDIICRAFQGMWEKMLEELTVHHVLGVPIAWVYTKEYQKRGLPHIHLLMTMRPHDKPITPDQVDTIVWAELPEENTPLYEKVKQHMMHGPCGNDDPTARCMVNGRCSKGFPFKFQEETNFDENGFPEYRRRNNGSGFDKEVGPAANRRIVRMDNRYVVPYNPYLVAVYNAHVCVVICSQREGSLKYIYKYITKGTDAANVTIAASVDEHGAPVLDGQGQRVHNYDEIAHYTGLRSLSSIEAVDHILGGVRLDKSHTIYRLPVHTPNGQTVNFRLDGSNAAEALEAARFTELTEFFTLNTVDPDASRLLYADVPKHYVWKEPSPLERATGQVKKWARRERGGGKVLSRIYQMSIHLGEVYFIRLLLQNVRGPQSFKQLRTVDGELCPTFRDACIRLNLVEDDLNWIATLNEVFNYQMPAELRATFVNICVYGQPTNVNLLFNHALIHMCEDIVRDYPDQTPEFITNRCLIKLEELFLRRGTSCGTLGLQVPVFDVPIRIDDDGMYTAEQNAEIGLRMSRTLNAEQQIIYDRLLASSQEDGEQTRAFYIDAPGGTGKTYVLTALMHVLRGQGHVVLPTALTGIAASLYDGGKTAHGRFGVPVPLNVNSMSKLAQHSEFADLIRRSKIIFIDEGSMGHKYLYNVIHRFLCLITGKQHLLFGGKCVVICGDYMQTLPITKYASESDVLSTLLTADDIWDRCMILTLQANMRAQGQEHEEFRAWTKRIGSGLEPTHEGRDLIKLPDQVVVPEAADLIERVFGQSPISAQLTESSNRAIMCPTNQAALEINNDIVLNRVQGRLWQLASVDSLIVENEEEQQQADQFPVEIMHELFPSGLPPHILNIRIGVVVMLLVNIDTAKGLCNGTRLIVRNVNHHIIDIEILSGPHRGNRCLLNKFRMDERESTTGFRIRRFQFPIRLAYAITINKAQGQTYDRVGLDLQQPVFSHGQLYVAVSRVRSFQTLFIKVAQVPDVQGVRTINGVSGTFTKNKVLYGALTYSPELLADPNFRPATAAPLFNPLLHQHRAVLPPLQAANVRGRAPHGGQAIGLDCAQVAHRGRRV